MARWKRQSATEHIDKGVKNEEGQSLLGVTKLGLLPNKNFGPDMRSSNDAKWAD